MDEILKAKVQKVLARKLKMPEDTPIHALIHYIKIYHPNFKIVPVVRGKKCFVRGFEFNPTEKQLANMIKFTKRQSLNYKGV